MEDNDELSYIKDYKPNWFLRWGLSLLTLVFVSLAIFVAVTDIRVPITLPARATGIENSTFCVTLMSAQIDKDLFWQDRAPLTILDNNGNQISANRLAPGDNCFQLNSISGNEISGLLKNDSIRIVRKVYLSELVRGALAY